MTEKNKGGRPRGAKSIKTRIQGHIMRAMKELDSNPSRKGLTELLVESFEEDVRATLTVTSKYMPKEIHTTKEEKHTHEHRLVELDETLKQLHGMARDAAAELEAATPEKPVSH